MINVALRATVDVMHKASRRLKKVTAESEIMRVTKQETIQEEM